MNVRAALLTLSAISLVAAGLVLGFGYLTRPTADQCAQIGMCSTSIGSGYIAVCAVFAVLAVVLFVMAHAVSR